MQPLIQIEENDQDYLHRGVETHALAGVHLSIDRGEYVAMSGPSGCGKSTLLSIIGLLDTPTAGKYELNGRSVENLKFAERSRIRNQEIGFIFQSFNLIGDLTVAENVELPLTRGSGMASSDRKTRVQESLERVGVAQAISPLSLSTLWRSAAKGRRSPRPGRLPPLSILLADEPTGRSWVKNGEAVMELLKNLHREGATICMVTHDPRFARHADRNIHLLNGKDRGRKQTCRSRSRNAVNEDKGNTAGRFCSVTTLSGSAYYFPFVISTGAYRISCFALPATTTGAVSRKGNRMNLINATDLDRKSGGAQWRDLCVDPLSWKCVLSPGPQSTGAPSFALFAKGGIRKSRP